MDKQQILTQVSEILEVAYLQTRSLTNNPEKFSAIEADLVKDYLRIAYDKLNIITYLAANENPNSEKTEPEEIEPEKIEPEKMIETPQFIPQAIMEDVSKNTETNENQTIEIEFETSPSVENSVQEKVVEKIVEKPKTEDNPTNIEKKPLDFVWEQPEKEDIPNVQNNENQIVAEIFHENADTIIGKMEKETEDHSVLSKISKLHIDDLKKAIGINDRFLFINELFNGNISSYNQFIEDLDKFDDGLQAWEYIETVKSKKSWDSTSTAYKRLFEIVERKFL